MSNESPFKDMSTEAYLKTDEWTLQQRALRARREATAQQKPESVTHEPIGVQVGAKAMQEAGVVIEWPPDN